MIQIHSGPIKKVKILYECINILDPGFNLHLRSNSISETWVVEKPTEDGVVTSIESFDKEGEIIVTFFGARKPGLPEREEWRKLVQDLKEGALRSEEHTSELQSRGHLVCRLLLEKQK